MLEKRSFAVLAVSCLLVLAGCSGAPGEGTDPSPIIDTVSSSTPAAQERTTATETRTEAPETDTSGGGTTDGGASTPAESSTTPAAATTAAPEPTSSPAQTATLTPRQTPTATPIRTATATPTPIATPTPAPTPTATSTPAATPTATPTPITQTATVVEVVDGDTVKLKFPDGSRETARLLGVDTPETYAPVNPAEWAGIPDSEAGRACLERWGSKATRFTTDRLLGETVSVAFDDNEPKRGYFGRLLVYVSVDGALFNDDLVRQGYARVYTDSRFTEKSVFLRYEQAAQSSNLGAWTCRDAVDATPVPTDPSKDEPAGGGSGSLVVDEIHADAAGNDHENENGEWIRFRNAGDATLDISGWTISDAANHDYRVPAGTTIAPGATITLYTGSGTDTTTDLYWGSESAIWNNGGDTIIVTTDSGQTAIRQEY